MRMTNGSSAWQRKQDLSFRIWLTHQSDGRSAILIPHQCTQGFMNDIEDEEVVYIGTSE